MATIIGGFIGYEKGLKNGLDTPRDVKVVYTKAREYPAYPEDGTDIRLLIDDDEPARCKDAKVTDEKRRIVVEVKGIQKIDFKK